jgi:hypothetical protein
MRQQQLESLVLSVIDRARTGQPIEDDRFEFKQEWPDPSRARQLAGLANRANGDYVIYILGADESGTIFALDAVDPADWWAQVSSKFDGVAPELVNHLNVPIGENESVTALHFATDRAPYVIKVGSGGSPEREVPIRDGTRTRSARRDELLRMLGPQAVVPSAVLLDSGLDANWHLGQRGGEGTCYLSGSASIFLEHTANSGVMLPMHDMGGTLETSDRVIPISISLWLGQKGEVPPSFGVDVRHDGVVATGPGLFDCRFSAGFDAKERDFLKGVDEWKLRLKFGVTGSTKMVQVEGLLVRAENYTPFIGEVQVQLARWSTRVAHHAGVAAS